VKLKSVIPWVWTGLVFAVASLALLFIWPDDPTPDLVSQAGSTIFALTAVLLTGLGALIATKQPGNRISWLFFVTGTGMLVVGALGSFIPEEAPVSPTFWNWLAIVVVDVAGVAAIFYPLFLLLYVFPTGRFLARRWTWAGWFGAIMVPVALLATVFAEEVAAYPDSDGTAWAISNPIGFIPSGVLDVIGFVWISGLIVVAISGVIAVIVRYRRSSQLVRTQIKWLLYPGLIFAIAFVLITLGAWEDNDILNTLLFVAPIALIPISMTVAITRYRLFEIDRIISRTLAYLLVVGLLAATYFGTVTFVTTRLPAPNGVAVAGSTLLVAALFNPLRKRIQTTVDRRFNRSSYRAQQVADQFGTQLQESLTIEEITHAWIETVDQVVEPEGIAVWLQTETPPGAIS
jgi:hypothetical protein